MYKPTRLLVLDPSRLQFCDRVAELVFKVVLVDGNQLDSNVFKSMVCGDSADRELLDLVDNVVFGAGGLLSHCGVNFGFHVGSHPVVLQRFELLHELVVVGREISMRRHGSQRD